MKKIILTLLGSLIMLSGKSQNSECGFTFNKSSSDKLDGINSPHRIPIRDFKRSASRSIEEIPIQAHIVRDNNGNGGTSILNIQNAVNQANSNFASMGLKFILCNVNYIENSSIYSYYMSSPSSSVEVNMANTYNKPNVINIYFVDNSATSWAYFPLWTNDWVLINSGQLNNSSTFTHELGHYYGLYHTHETAFGNELVNGSNCTTTGDKLCGTNADPSLSGKVNGSCIYTGTNTDANGQFYSPDPKNIMSYSLQQCRTFFSNDQKDRIVYNHLNTRNNIQVPSNCCVSHATEYNGDKIKKKVSGDFDGDGKDDVAMLYDYGNAKSTLHVLLSDGSQFVYQGDAGWWSSNSYNANSVRGMVAGDFNNDGKDDIAITYHYGGNTTRVHTLLSTGSSFNFQGSGGWFSSNGYNGNAIRGMVAGDYNNDGKDDVALVYYYGNTLTRIHTLLSTGSSFSFQGSGGWFSSNGYNGNAIRGVTSGDYNNDGRDDVAMVYYYGNNLTRIHTFLSSGSSFVSQGFGGWFSSYDYNGNAIRGIASGDYNNDGKDDIALPYYHGYNYTVIHAFLSNGSSFSYQGQNGWSVLNSYNGNAIRGFSAGNYTGNNYDDISIAYYYGNAKTQIHAGVSDGTKFSVPNNEPWWGCNTYAIVEDIPVAENNGFKTKQEFLVYPNPNNGTFNIDLTKMDQQIISIEVYNEIGQRVFFNENIAGTSEIVNLENKSNGLYFVKINLKDQVLTKKIIIN